jgi:hypothetical protein
LNVEVSLTSVENTGSPIKQERLAA